MRRRDVIGALAVLTASPLLAQPGLMPDLSHLSPEQRRHYEELHARMMAAFAVEQVIVPGAQALAEVERRRVKGAPIPIATGGDEQFERLAEQFSIDEPFMGNPATSKPQTSADILRRADALHFPDGFAAWEGGYKPEDLRAPLGEWPDGPAETSPGLTVVTDLQTGRPLDRVHLLLVPATASSEVPAHLRWGGWNACPPPEWHVAALRHWHERYGAELIGIDGDTMNVRVTRRPADRAEALALAREQYHYCPDLVDQGVGTLSMLAASLMASDWWFFWWD